MTYAVNTRKTNMLTIDRKYYEDCTISRVTVEGYDFQCFFLELPDLNNQQYISCIPEGQYEAFKRFSPSKQKEVIQYEDVPNRTYIQIHEGNFTSQILGCQLPGDGVKWLNADGIPDVTNSGDTMGELMSMLPDRFTVTIKS